ncbi:cell division cycle-associated protein 2 isoform X2 [Takifugu flavidus]|uniref:cell division cycle-associated protein 2 isoform X2 n=1 Tax=Takifugu flavidus TaxID=433684 RepID=UPI0025444CB2|nr:cell division cycle-associated protein 2 isoform X2 [Takifugu flavidus]
MDGNDVTVGDDEKENESSENSSPLVNCSTPVLNSPELTTSQFGICAQSFTPSATPKDKSGAAKLKARRKSSVGARGSPETNSLIRFMAQQKIQSASPSQSPELVRFCSNQLRVASTLKQKMASFQNLMDVEESQVCNLMPRQDSSAGGCMRTEDDLSDRDGHNLEREKENYPSSVSPMFTWSAEDQEEMEKGAYEGITQAESPSCDFAEMLQSDLTPSSLPLLFDLWSSYPTESQQGCGFEDFVDLSPGTSAAALEYQPTSSNNIPPLSAELDVKPPAVKKKSVHFGSPLSPEVFDKTMPPSTPLRKGATPAQALTPGGGATLRSALKTPQMSDSDVSHASPDPCSPFMLGASPLLEASETHMQSAAADGEEEGKIVFPSTVEFDFTALDEEYMDAQTLNLNTAFYEDALAQIQAECEKYLNTISLMEELQPEPETQPEATVGAPPLRRSKRKKPATEYDCASESNSRKKEKSEEVEPVTRTLRSAAKMACGKIKASVATRKWNKEVDRSLYSSRAYASKNPTLSPIKERRSFIRQPPVTESKSEGCTDDDTNLNLKIEAAVPGKRSEDSVGDRCAPEIAMGTDENQPGLEERSSVDVQLNVVTAGETEAEQGQEQTAATPEASWELPLAHTEPEPRVVDPTLDQTSVETCSSVSDATLEGTVALRAASSPRPPSAESSDNERQRKVKRGRRSSGNALQPHTGCKAVEGDQLDQQHIQLSSSESPDKGGAASVDLAPWQSDFNLEDVFRPVATRGQRSVRRSLRNQSGRGQSSAGLAWLPRTSPDSIREVRRRTRSRRLSAALLSEET